MASKSKSKAARPLNLAKLQETKSTIRFSANLFRPASKPTEKIVGIGSWTLLTLPKNASAKLPCPPSPPET